MGTVNAASITPGTITDTDIAVGAAIDATKLKHQVAIASDFDLESDATPVAKTFPVFIAPTAGSVAYFAAALVDSGTTTDVNFDLLKNGTTILTGAANVVHGTGDRTAVQATISSASFVAGDVFEFDLAVTSSTGALGPIATAVFTLSPVT